MMASAEAMIPFEIVDRGGRFDLGHDGRRPAPRLADLAHLPNVFGFADEREGDVVDAQRKTEREIGLVFFGERRDAHAA